MLSASRYAALFMNATNVRKRSLGWGEGLPGLSQTGMFAQSPHGWVHGVPGKPSPQPRLRLRPTFPVHEEYGGASKVHRVCSAQLEDLSAHALRQHFVF